MALEGKELRSLAYSGDLIDRETQELKLKGLIEVCVWTSGSLNKGLPIKIAREMFQQKCYFFHEKKVGSTLKLSAKVFFSLDK